MNACFNNLLPYPKQFPGSDKKPYVFSIEFQMMILLGPASGLATKFGKLHEGINPNAGDRQPCSTGFPGAVVRGRILININPIDPTAILSWSDTEIRFMIPAGSSPGIYCMYQSELREYHPIQLTSRFSDGLYRKRASEGVMEMSGKNILLSMTCFGMLLSVSSQAQQPKEINKTVDPADVKVVECHAFNYPSSARLIQGAVVVRVKLDESGGVIAAEAISGSDALVPETLLNVKK